MIGLPRHHRRQTGSTNADARRLAELGAPHGTMVSADEQTAGRGRQGRAWHSPPGRAALQSFVLRRPPELLTLRAGLAVSEVCEGAAGVRCGLKWPNDVWIEGRKVAGVLGEARAGEDWAVLGIGINVTTTLDELGDELRGAATSLVIEAPAGRAVTVEAVRSGLLAALDAALTLPDGEVLEGWRARDALSGRRVRWSGGEGVAAGISAAGELLVGTGESGGEVALDAGEVHLLP